ncbi:MAG: nucleotidyltransferase domain-containing protein, partial [Deferribacteres bacterium]|nr:nucleotidyltransferase domain-containing protein [Deferribacteres bacterium]
METTDGIVVGGGLIEFLKLDENVLFAVLFGSVAKDKAGRGSDLDIAIYF